MTPGRRLQAQSGSSQRLPETHHVYDWSLVPENRYRRAQGAEELYWTQESRRALVVRAKYYYYVGRYEWSRNRLLLNPFRSAISRPQNFHLQAADLEGKSLLDIGCGPTSHTLSLVHCANVHVLDPLLEVYQKMQPFGWEFFASLSRCGAEQLPFEKHTLDFVHCANVLDHTRDAAEILAEVGRANNLGRGQPCCMLCSVRVGGCTLTPQRY